MVENVDTDGSGSIEFMEFLLLMGRILNDSPNQEDLRNIFTGRDIERVKSSWSSCSPWAGYSMIHPTRRTSGTY